MSRAAYKHAPEPALPLEIEKEKAIAPVLKPNIFMNMENFTNQPHYCPNSDIDWLRM